jgi:hypothetical protein
MWALLAWGWKPDSNAWWYYQRMVGDEVYRRTADYLERLPASVDRAGYFSALILAEVFGLSIKLLSPEWCRRRDEALRNLGAAIEQFKSVLRDWDVFPRLSQNPLVIWAAELESEFRVLTRPLGGEPNLMLMTPKDVGRSNVGRPVSPARYARKFLREAGVPPGKIDGALRAAGLDEESPHFAER